ncbi:MAG: aspartyl/asparaginyl beta-hydroxylase domain-containing protein [Sphingosinicella sp.]
MAADSQIGQLLASAQEAQRRGDHEAAERRLEQVLAQDPHNAAALNSLGMRALARDDPAAAEGYFARAVEADAAAPALRLNLATARRRRGDDDGERAALLGALAIDQRNLMANIRLAELHERRGETGPACYRWSAVAAIGQMLTEPAAELQPVFERARMFVADYGHRFGEAIDEGLAPHRAGLSPAQRRRFDACVDVMLGRRRIYANVCEGVHFPFLPADEFFDREHFPWLGEIEAHTGEIREEVEALIRDGQPGFVPYVDMGPGLPDNKWSALDKSLDWSAFFLWHFGERREEACARCPRTAAALDLVPKAEMLGRAPTAFFSILKPGTHLPPHNGVSNVRTIIHLPLIVPPDCGFRVGGETREWTEGEALAFDDTIEHEAWNRSDRLRAVLIFDVWNPYLSEDERRLLQRYFTLADASGLDPGLTAISD